MVCIRPACPCVSTRRAASHSPGTRTVLPHTLLVTGMSKSNPRVVYFSDSDWENSGAPYIDGAHLGADAPPLLRFLVQQGVEAAIPDAAPTSFKDDL